MTKRSTRAKRAGHRDDAKKLKPAAGGARPPAETKQQATGATLDLNAKQEPNHLFTPQQVITALELSRGFNSIAAQRLGCSPTTVQNYVERYPEIAAAKEVFEIKRLDLAESVVDDFMGQDKLPFTKLQAAMFMLRTKGKKRGFVEGREHSGPNGGAIPVTPVPYDLANLSETELATYERLARKAISSQPGSRAP